jgi:hypothetical protein
MRKVALLTIIFAALAGAGFVVYKRSNGQAPATSDAYGGGGQQGGGRQGGGGGRGFMPRQDMPVELATRSAPTSRPMSPSSAI